MKKMTKKSLLFIGALALSTLSFAGAKSYEILLPYATEAGTVTLSPAHYRVSLLGSNAVFTNINNSHSFVVPVKIENTKKHESTAVETKSENGAQRIVSIDLAGSDETLEF
jgi:hypothetical protein